MPDMHAVNVHENEFGEISFPSAKKDYLPSHHDKVVFAEEKAQKRLQKPFARRSTSCRCQIPAPMIIYYVVERRYRITQPRAGGGRAQTFSYLCGALQHRAST